MGGEAFQLGWGHLVDDRVGDGRGTDGGPRHDVLAYQGDGPQRAVAVAAVGLS
jgi:hypothetical protein